LFLKEKEERKKREEGLMIRGIRVEGFYAADLSLNF
jgi:hypothetical protein